MARPRLWGMVLFTIFEVGILFLMWMKLTKILRMNHRRPGSNHEGRQGLGVYSSLLIALVLYTILLAISQAVAWYCWAIDWWGVWVLLVVPLTVPCAFVGILHFTRHDYSLDAQDLPPLEEGHIAHHTPAAAASAAAAHHAASAGHPQAAGVGGGGGGGGGGSPHGAEGFDGVVSPAQQQYQQHQQEQQQQQVVYMPTRHVPRLVLHGQNGIVPTPLPKPSLTGEAPASVTASAQVDRSFGQQQPPQYDLGLTAASPQQLHFDDRAGSYEYSPAAARQGQYASAHTLASHGTPTPMPYR
eukprot:Rhum_TRINITY_DN12752_c1_g1::Rhum_TRINITY_DN12752_c1_g1_i1::g.54207::m.54207